MICVGDATSRDPWVAVGFIAGDGDSFYRKLNVIFLG